jgi:hypothetical protein
MAQKTDVTPDDLVTRVDSAAGGITLANLLELRSAFNRGRMTPGVLDWIREKLEREHRLGVIVDNEVETSQDQAAYLYKLDQPIGRLLMAALNPSEAGLRHLREVAAPAHQAVQADDNLSAVKAALEDATSALSDYLGENGKG